MAGHGSKEEFIGGATYLMTFPERGLVVAVMANISFADTKSIALNIAQAFAEQQRSQAWSGPFTPVEPAGSFAAAPYTAR